MSLEYVVFLVFGEENGLVFSNDKTFLFVAANPPPHPFLMQFH